ncbi:MAG: hypothetical protein JO222_08780, partial [Frankiales bacterium]|nr:hypothetical protein [Frankiales bacterium]
LAPAAIVYIIVSSAVGDATFTTQTPAHALMLASAGVVTAVPLLLFAAAAASVPLSRLGVFFYLSPTLQFLVGALIQHEPVTTTRLVGFGLVWVALAVFTADSVASHRQRQLALAAEAAAA